MLLTYNMFGNLLKDSDQFFGFRENCRVGEYRELTMNNWVTHCGQREFPYRGGANHENTRIINLHNREVRHVDYENMMVKVVEVELN